MHEALWLLLGLRGKSWLRRLGRMLRTVKGALLALGILLCFAPLVVSAFAAVYLDRPPQRAADPETVRRYGTVILAGYCLMVLLLTSPERALYFSPAEVDFLFAGPFARRQLLLYKLITVMFTLLPGAIIMAVVFRPYAYLFLATFTGLYLAMLFLQLFVMAVGLAAATVGALAYSRARKLLLAVVAGGVVVAVLGAGTALPPLSLRGAAELVERTPALGMLLAPLRCFVEVFTAERLWPDLVLWSALALAVDGCLAGLVLALDYQYLESAALASEKLYATLQRIRKGGVAAQWAGGGEKVRSSLPSLPWWGGVGPNCWRQLVAARRSMKGITIFLVVLGISVVLPGLGQGRSADRAFDGGSLAGMLVTMSVFIAPMLFTFDFRGDIDRMDVLKALPLPAATLVLGQLLAPVLVASALEILLVAAVQALVGGVGVVLAAAVAFAVPVNFLLFGLENLLFLLYPTRLAATPGDVQAMGRQMVFFWGKLLCLGLIAGVIALAASFAALATDGGWPVALAAAWVLLVAVDVALLPPLCSAFRKFDVARDTPP